MPFEDVGLWAETIAATGGLMSYSLTAWLLLPTPDTVGTPIGNNGPMPTSYMGRTISVTGKTKVGGKLSLCSYAKFVLPFEYQKHMPRPAKVYP